MVGIIQYRYTWQICIYIYICRIYIYRHFLHPGRPLGGIVEHHLSHRQWYNRLIYGRIKPLCWHLTTLIYFNPYKIWNKTHIPQFFWNLWDIFESQRIQSRAKLRVAVWSSPGVTTVAASCCKSSLDSAKRCCCRSFKAAYRSWVSWIFWICHGVFVIFVVFWWNMKYVHGFCWFFDEIWNIYDI